MGIAGAGHVQEVTEIHKYLNSGHCI